MDIKLIALDMDGTLLNSKKEMPEDFEEWVFSHPDKKVVIASGRQYASLIRDLGHLKDHLIYIAENGGLVYDKDEIIHEDTLSAENVRKCFSYFEKLDGIAVVICGVKSAYMINPTEEIYQNTGIYYANMTIIDDVEEALAQDNMAKLALYVEDYRAEEIMPLFEELKADVNVVLSGDSWIDFANYSSTKGGALKAIMKKFGINRSEAMAFGDYHNDITLLESCEESYCMENGHPDVKAVAKHIADSNDNDGVMKVLRTL